MLRTSVRTSVPVFILACGLALASCDKGAAGPQTTTPGEEAGAEEEAAGIQLRYTTEPKTLAQTTDYELTISGGGQFGEAKTKLSANLEFQPMDGDKLKVAWNITEVPSLELKGILEPKDDKGGDPKEALAKQGEGAFVIDLRGETDAEATKELPENVKKREEAEAAKEKAEEAKSEKADEKADEGADDKAGDEAEEGEEDDGSADSDALGRQLLQAVQGAFQLPGLPEQRLEVGKELTIEEEEEVALQGDKGPKLPIESETIYKLVKIDDSSGKRIAEVTIEGVASGATEFQGGMLVVDQATDGTILFNLDDGVPVSVDLTSTQSFAVGDQGQEVVSVRHTEFSPG